MRIGSYINPETQEEDWIEPDTISQIMLVSKRVKRVGDTLETPIEFKMNWVEPEVFARFRAEFNADMHTYTSDTIEIPLEDLAEEIARVVYAKKSLDDAELIKTLKERALADLTAKLFNQGIILGDFDSKGIGYVTAQSKKVMTIESFSFNYSTDSSNNRVYNAILKQCVGPISLTNLENPRIVFYTGTHEIVFENPRVIDGKEGKINTYTIAMDDISISNFEYVTPEEIKDEDEFVQARINMLDNITDSGYDDIDDRFDDLF